MTKIRIIMLIAIIIVAFFAYRYFSASDVVEVTIVEAARGDVTSSVSNTRAGTVEACRRAGIAPTIGGQISKLHVAEGDAVTTDQILLELWNIDRAAELKLARREAQAARARAQEACVIADVAKREAERLTKLNARGLASEESADKAVGESQARASACTASRVSATVSEARVEVVEAALERTILRAPFDGIVAEINGELGEFVTPSPVGIPTPPTVDLIDQTCLYITAPIDEIDAPYVAAGLPAWITLDAFPDRKFSGEVRRVAPYVFAQEKQARTVEIEAVIDDPDKSQLLPGYSADVEVMLGRREDVLRVPTSVILEGGRVFVFKDGNLEERTIERGLSNWEYTEIVSGLSAGERVVTSVDREGVEDGAEATIQK